MPYQYRCYGDHDKMQDSERMRVSPILKPDHDSHHKWLDFTVQVRRLCLMLIKELISISLDKHVSQQILSYSLISLFTILALAESIMFV